MRYLLAVLVLTGCAANLPQGEDESDRPEIQALFEAWDQAGMADVSACGAQHWARVDPETFKDACGDYSCSAGKVGSCMQACTPVDDVSTAFWDETLHANDPGAESFARAHEQVHAWLKCTTGSADADHTNARAWSVLHSIERDLRAMR